MKNNLRHKVLLLLKLKDVSKYDLFNQAFELYKATAEKSPAVEVKLNRIGFTDDGLANLLYDLQKLHNISDTEIHTAVSPAELKSEEIKIATANVVKLQSVKRPNKKAIAAAQAIVDDLKEELAVIETPEVEEEQEGIPEIPLNSDNSDLQQKAAAVYTKTAANVEEEEDGEKGLGVSEFEPIRREYDFLNDADCPDVLYIVAGKAISAFRTHQKLHAKLQEVLAGTLEIPKEEQDQLATATHNAFAENRVLWDEMNYYKEHKEILGKHPLFRELVAKREVEAMTMEQLAKYLGSSAKFLSEKRTALKNPKLTEEKQNQLLAAIADREYKLGLVNTKLGADGKK
jgi:hypothetical protein